MAAPVRAKCVFVLIVLGVAWLYIGCAFKIRDAGHAEQHRGTCSAGTGRCPVGSATHLYSRKLERVSMRGTFAKIQRPPVGNGDDDRDGQKVVVGSEGRTRVEDKPEDDSDEDAVVEDDDSAEDEDRGVRESVEESADGELKDEGGKDGVEEGEKEEVGKEVEEDDDSGGSEDESNDESDGHFEEEGVGKLPKDEDECKEEDEEASDGKDEGGGGDDGSRNGDESKPEESGVTAVDDVDEMECSEEVVGEGSAEGRKSEIGGERRPESDGEESRPKSTVGVRPARTLEKVKYADKDKVRKANASFANNGEASGVRVAKEIPTIQPIKLVDSTKHAEAAKPKPKIKETNDTSGLSLKPKNITKSETTKVTTKIMPQPIAPQSAKQKPVGKPMETTTKPKVHKSQVVDAKPEVAAKPKERSDGPITLTELNDAILSVPTFVLNFTAVEDAACQQHGKIFLRQLRGFKLWALQMLDSSAKIPAGLLRGNVNQLGDFDQCLGVLTRVKVNEQVIKIQGKYCLATVDVHATRPHMKVAENLMQSRAFVRGNMHDPGHFIPRFTTINWALCLPAACSADDAKRAVTDALQPYNLTLGMKFAVDVDPSMCYVKQKSQGLTKETIGVLYFYAMIVCLVITASVRDYFVKSEEKGNYAERIIMSFSLQRNVRALWKDNAAFPEDVTCIHGIRSLSTLALYVAHKLIPTCRMPYANRVTLTEVANSPISSVLRVSLVYTDSFLLLSGVLTAYNMAKELTVRGEIRWFCRLVTRYIRLTPSLLVIIFWYTFVMEHVGSGPQWNSVIKANSDICKRNAWTNLFYIQNFFPFEEMCATHTHQLALDMQLSLAAPILVYFLRAKPVIGALMIFFLLQVSATLRYFAVVYNNLSLVIFHGMTIKQLYKTANLTYVLPIHRATPYLSGVALGVFLQYCGKHVHIHKVFVIFGWIVAIVLGLWSMFSPWRLARRDYVYDVEEAASYAVLSPILSALALCWIIFACFTNHGGFINKLLSHHWLVVFSRISYAVYLTQFAVFFYNVGSTRYSSEFEILSAINIPELAVVIFISVVITLFFDIPMQEVKNVLLECTHEGSDAEIVEKPRDEAVVDEDLEPKEQSTDMLYDDKSCQRNAKGLKLRRQDARKQGLIRSDAYDSEELRSYMNVNRRYEDEEDERDEAFMRDRYARLSRGDEFQMFRRERSSSRTSTRSNKEDYGRASRIEYWDRLSSLDSEEGQSWEFVRRERSLPRNRDRVREYSPRSGRLSVPKFVDLCPSSGSEEERRSGRELKMDQKRNPVVVLRVSDDDDWNENVDNRRDSYSDRIEDEEMDSLRRRSSAEGKRALLQDPIDNSSMDFWTVSKVSQLGSSIEPSEPEDEDKREVRDSINSDRDSSMNTEKEQRSVSDESKMTSGDEEDVATFDFVLRKDSKRITVQDLSKLSPDREMVDPDEDAEPVARVSSGLFKRESIIKSQASEEDPEYLLPERPKLQEQEQDHPFKKAWQQQKSRSEEDGTSGYAIKKPEICVTTSDNESKDDTQSSGEKAIEHEFNYNWQVKSIEIEETQTSENPEADGNTDTVNWSSDEEQCQTFSPLNIKIKKTHEDNCVFFEEEYQNQCQ